MLTVSMTRSSIRQQAGINFSWNTVAAHLLDLETEGVVKRLVHSRSRDYLVSYRAGKKAGTTERRAKTNAWYQLTERFRPVAGLSG